MVSMRGIRDHPRIRGEHLRPFCFAAVLLGIIPAYAGNTRLSCAVSGAHAGSSPHTRGTPWTRSPAPSWTRDHPRIRGEHVARPMAQLLAVGIIPAYAGNTEEEYYDKKSGEGSSPHTRGTPSASSRATSSTRDHPRIRGEHKARGVLGNRGAGIIPAYAGNTKPVFDSVNMRRGSSPHTRGTPCTCASCTYRPWDHPRIRGEQCPPPVAVGVSRGIIPAYAGNTLCLPSCCRVSIGSSPHTRGTRSPWTVRSYGTWDHPRIRGEHETRPQRPPPVAGIIPAYAGNTRARCSRWTV